MVFRKLKSWSEYFGTLERFVAGLIKPQVKWSLIFCPKKLVSLYMSYFTSS